MSETADITQWLSAARDDSLTPFLQLSQARALSYDAAADTSRFLLSGNLALYQQDFTRKSGCLVGNGNGGGACGSAGLAPGRGGGRRRHRHPARRRGLRLLLLRRFDRDG